MGSPERLFGQEMRRLRELRGLSQEALGFQANLHRTYVSQLERGLKSPTLGVVLNVAAALSCSAAEIVGAVESALRQERRPTRRRHQPDR